MAGWHDVSVRALGVRTAWSADAWVALDPSHPIYFDAIALHPEARGEPLARAFADADRTVAICDPFGFDLAPFGFERGDDQRWFFREPGPLPAPTPPRELVISLVADEPGLRAWEAASVEGFLGEAVRVRPGELHATAILDDQRMRVWLGRVRDRPVSGAMTFADTGVVGTYGTSTVPAARRRGYARSIALHSLATAGAATRPAVVQPSAESEGLYRALGFHPLAAFRTWLRRQQA